MKREKWLSCLVGILLASGIAFAGVGCLTTAFQLPWADLAQVFMICLLAATVACVCFSFRYGGFFLMAILALLMGYLIREGTFQLETEALIYQISEFYDSGYGWGLFEGSGHQLKGQDVTGGLALIGVSVALVVSWVVCCRKWSVFAILAGLLPLAACCVVTDTVPDVGYLWLLLAGFGLLLLTQNVRRRSAGDGMRLTALLLVPVMLASTILFALNPEEDYELQANNWQQTVLSWLKDLPIVVQDPDGNFKVSIDGTISSQVNLLNVGPKAKLRNPVMDVVSDRSEKLYLRGQVFDTYDGVSWSISEVSTGKDLYWPSQDLVSGGTVTVETILKHSFLYAPYYPAQGQWGNGLVDGTLENEERIKTYSFQRMVLRENGVHGTINLSNSLVQQCMQLPRDTYTEAKKIVDRLISGGRYTYSEEIQIICDYVEGSAEYSLKTGRMPSEESDFALWFLEESDTGYCVHFATAATVLLRAAGIPARYVTGYTMDVNAGVRETITADKAHAWVEYLDRERGCWMILDPTPPDPEEEEIPTETTEPTEATQPIETTKPTEATEPVETTQPDETEVTTQPTEESANENGGNPAKKDIRWLWKLLVALGCVFAVIAGIIGQYRIRRRKWRKHMRTGPNNRRAIWRWRYVLRMAKLTGEKPPEVLLELAEKAIFSQHTLTVSELMEFDVWMEQARQALCEKPWIKRTVIRLIWAVE